MDVTICLQEGVGVNSILRTRNKAGRTPKGWTAVLEVTPHKKTFRRKTKEKVYVAQRLKQGSMLGSGVYPRRQF